MMKRSVWKRLLALCLCVCVAPVWALAEEAAGDGVTRSAFTLSLALHPDGFPNDGAAHYRDWETLLNKLSLRGTVDVQRFLTPTSRVYFDGGLYVNGQESVPFVYDGYHSYRYIRSDALRGDSIHFQMHNFFEFMLKGYYFMGLPTQLIALFLYPEATYYLADSYYTPIAELLGGEGNRAVSHAELYELCEQLDLIVNEDFDYERAYFYFTSLLVDLGASDIALSKLGDLESWLFAIDPDERGMTITQSGDTQTYALGETQVFEKTVSGGQTSFALFLPDDEGYALAVSYQNGGDALSLAVKVTLEDEERLALSVKADGLLTDGAVSASGTVEIAVSGACLMNQPDPVRLAYRYARDAQALPYGMTLEVDWLHPATQSPALTLHYQADMSAQPASVMVERTYDNQNDFFHLNESFMSEYKELYVPSLAAALLPLALELPAGVISDVAGFLYQTGILAFLGIE
ncbi:MAG: hypothetical protein Q4C35_08325 [Eubacteriales bacterium]|nr:hypothetical protein [Eubacteriales bacterium]